MLTWETAQEVGTSRFIVERSFDGRRFHGVGSVVALGESDRVQNYGFTDQLVPEYQLIYYRLKIVDFDGAFEYTPIQVIRINEYHPAEEKSIVIQRELQNPRVAGLIPISLSSTIDQAVNMDLLTADGKVVSSRRSYLSAGLNDLVLDASVVVTGVYLLRITTGQHSIIKRLIIK